MNRKLRNTLFLVIAALIAALGGAYVRTILQSAPAAKDHAIALEQLRRLQLPDLDNQLQSISQWQNKLLVINFWATWCPPCIKEIPEFIELANQFGEQNVQFVGISLDSAQNVKTFRTEHAVSYPLLVAPIDALDITEKLGNHANALPFTVILRPNGELLTTKLGPFSKTDLSNILTQAIQQQN